MEGRVWSTEYSTAVPGALDTALQSENSIQSCDTLPPPTPVYLLSAKSITMSTATVDQRKIVRWKWQGVQRIGGKAGTRFILGRKGCLRCSADCGIGYNKSFCYAPWYFSMGQTTTRRRCPSCVTTRCDREGPGSLEQMVDVYLFAWPDCCGAALHLLIIPRSHKRNPNVA